MPPLSEHSLPDALFTADAVRRIDRYVIDEAGVDGFELMQAAARAAFRGLMKRWPKPGRVLVLCGAGNNGGDGYLVAAQAVRHGLAVSCVAVTPTGKLAGDARKAWQRACADGVTVTELTALDGDGLDQLFDACDLIVDALLGTGVSGAPRDAFAAIIERCNRSGRPVLAVDVPSGLDATTGAAPGQVVRATMTVTFIGLKSGLFTGQGPAVCGDVLFDALNVNDQAAGSGQAPIALLRDWSRVGCRLPRRAANAHKGRFGHVLIIAGERGFGGAGLMAAEAALRSGAGLVSLATRPEHVPAALARCPSVMAHGVIHGSELAPLLATATVVVCGPGIGQGAWGQQMLQQVLASNLPRVLDADALNLLAGRVAVPSDRQVLTPHPGEAARLLGCGVAQVEADRIAAAEQLQSLYGGVVLLKGAGTVIASGGKTVDIVNGRNPGMATAGMGDVLAGMIGALAGQLESLSEAAVVGACAHLAAANRASQAKGYMGLIATDVIEALPDTYRRFESVEPMTLEDE